MPEFYQQYNIEIIDKKDYEIEPWYSSHTAPYEQWKEAILATLRKLASTKAGAALLLSIQSTVQWITVQPLMSSRCNAEGGGRRWINSGRYIGAYVELEPHRYKSGSECFRTESLANPRWNHGKFADEVLFHELVHAYRGLLGVNDSAVAQGGLRRYDHVEEFFAIVLTNIYISDLTNHHASGLRADHVDGRPLEDELSCSFTFYRSSPRVITLMDQLVNENYLLCCQLAAVKAVFNPLAAYFKNWHLAHSMSQSAFAARRDRTVPGMHIPGAPHVTSNAEIIGNALKDEALRLLQHL